MSDPTASGALPGHRVGAAGELFAAVDPAIWLVTAEHNGRRSGLIATFVCQASIVPQMPRLLIGIARQHFTWELIAGSGSFAAMLLSDAQWPLVARFGLRSGRDQDKFAGLDVSVRDDRYVVISGSSGWLGCVVEAAFDIGDRTLFLGGVERAESSGRKPLRMSAWWPRATEHHAALKEQLERDAALDAEAIAAWRNARGRGADAGWARQE